MRLGECKDHKKSLRIFLGVSSVILILGIFFLTFQSQKQTESLSDSVFECLLSIGIRIDNIRSLVHVPMYYILGLAISLYGKSSYWKNRRIFIVSFAVALLDEGVKIFLPTREFELTDLSLDCFGIILAILTIEIIIKKLTITKTNHRRC